ncbi:hypothetical protein ES708_08883 [subsurface metagenome]
MKRLLITYGPISFGILLAIAILLSWVIRAGSC